MPQAIQEKLEQATVSVTVAVRDYRRPAI